ncbi:MAG: MBL fold metallo-hydrolase [Syntrophales bacterium]|nr:MBL fold metallo-hydrolase [Syntrophales bacterium]
MRHREPGQITEHLWYLGREEAGVYVLEGTKGSVIINGGVSYILPDVLGQIEKFGIDIDKINKMLILHSHFDHVGIVPYFKRTYPHIDIYASEQAWKVLKMPKAINIINEFGMLLARQMGREEELRAYDWEWRDDVSGATVGERDRIELGNFTLEIMHTPGHTNCSVTAYEPNIKALFASDGGGIPFRDTTFPSANTNFDEYAASLERLLPLRVDYLCADHYGYITGEEAQNFIAFTLSETKKLRTYMEDVLKQTGGDLERATRLVADDFYEKMPGYFITGEILEGVFKQMLKYLSKNLAQ